MTPIPVITDLGLSTPFGNAEQTFDRLSAAGVLTGGNRPIINNNPLSRVAALALQAASQIPILPNTPVIIGTSKGEIDEMFNLQFSPHGLSNLAHDIAQNLNLAQLPPIISAACASGLVALIHAAMLIQSGAHQKILVLATESSFHPILQASYQRLGVLSTTGCKPFDQHRSGFFVGEAAAAILLEAKNTLAPGDIAIDRSTLGSDAVSITAADPSGKNLQAILKKLDLHQVDLIHAHGTGTLLNDPIEWNAYESLLNDDQKIPLYSHKGALGHTLGAAGLLATVLTVMMMKKQTILPSPQTQTPLKSEKLKIHQEGFSSPIQKAAVIAAGFGGPVAAIRLFQACRK